MPVNFDLNDLYAFRALVEYGNFRIAAESICLSQSALSRRIDKLESALGLKLFERTTRRVTLTLKGQAFAERSGRLLADFEEVMADISEVSQTRTGTVTVACVPSAAYYFMPNVISRFRARYPRVRVKLIDSSAGNVYDAVMSGQADFGISFSGVSQPDIEFLPLLEDEYVAACRHEHPIAGNSSISWRDFYRHARSGWIKPPATATCSIGRWRISYRNGPASAKPDTSPPCWAWLKRARHCRRPRYVDAFVGSFGSDQRAADRSSGEAHGRAAA